MPVPDSAGPVNLPVSTLPLVQRSADRLKRRTVLVADDPVEPADPRSPGQPARDGAHFARLSEGRRVLDGDHLVPDQPRDPKRLDVAPRKEVLATVPANAPLDH